MLESSAPTFVAVVLVVDAAMLNLSKLVAIATTTIIYLEPMAMCQIFFATFSGFLFVGPGLSYLSKWIAVNNDNFFYRNERFWAKI